MKKILLILTFFTIFSCVGNKKSKIKIDSTEKSVMNTIDLSNKKHPILPNKLTFQLKTEEGKNIEIENILCHLNVYIDSTSYHTYSFIPTNSNGLVQLTKNQIIENTELKHSYSDNIKLENKPVKFDFFVMESDYLNSLISSMENYLKIDIESIKLDLKNRGFTDSQIALQIKPIREKLKADKELCEFLKKNRNAEIDKLKSEMKITDSWSQEIDYKYELK